MKLYQVACLFVVLLLTMSLSSGCNGRSRTDRDPPVIPTVPTNETSETSETKPEMPAGRVNRFRVGVSLQDESPFVLRVSETLQALANENEQEIELVLYNGRSNPMMQISHVESFISGGFDLILLNPISYEECAPAVSLAKEAGIDIITFIAPISNQSECLSYIGSSHFESGMLQAQMVVDYLDGTGRIVVLEGVMGIDSQRSRYEAYLEVFADYPQIEFVAIQTAAWLRDEAQIIVENWIENEKVFDVVLSENDNMAMGAIEALQRFGLEEDVAVFGIDGDLDALHAVKNGSLAGTVYHDSRRQAETIFNCIKTLSSGMPIESEYLIPFRPVERSNVESFISLHD